MDLNALPEILFRTIMTKKVLVKESDGVIMIMPVKEDIDCTSSLRGMFSEYPEITIDKFLERKHADRELDL